MFYMNGCTLEADANVRVRSIEFRIIKGSQHQVFYCGPRSYIGNHATHKHANHRGVAIRKMIDRGFLGTRLEPATQPVPIAAATGGIDSWQAPVECLDGRNSFDSHAPVGHQVFEDRIDFRFPNVQVSAEKFPIADAVQIVVFLRVRMIRDRIFTCGQQAHHLALGGIRDWHLPNRFFL